VTTNVRNETNHKIILWRVALLLILMGLLALSVDDLTHYANIPTVALTLAPLGLIALTVKLMGKQSPLPAIDALALPVGIFLAGAGLTQVFQSLTDLIAIPIVTAILVMPAIYVGVIAGVIHCWRGQKTETSIKISTPSTAVCLGVLLLLVIVTYADHLSHFTDRGDIWLLQAGIIIALALGRSPEAGIAKSLCNASLVSIMIMTILGIIELTLAGQKTSFSDLTQYMYAINTAYTAMTAGLVAYMASIIISFKTGELEELQLPTKNWHLIEAFSFLIFITLAPPSIYHFLDVAP
jgi:hypothetical protein